MCRVPEYPSCGPLPLCPFGGEFFFGKACKNACGVINDTLPRPTNPLFPPPPPRPPRPPSGFRKNRGMLLSQFADNSKFCPSASAQTLVLALFYKLSDFFLG